MSDISGDAPVVTLAACGCALRRCTARSRRRLRSYYVPPAWPTLSHTTPLVGTTQPQKSATAAATFPGNLREDEGMGESDMCSLREIVGGEMPAAKDIDRSLRISTDSKTPYSDATQVKYSINLDLRHILETTYMCTKIDSTQY